MFFFKSHKFNLNVSCLLFALLIINNVRGMEKKQELTEDKKYAEKIVNLLLTQRVQKSPLQFDVSMVPSPQLNVNFDWNGDFWTTTEQVQPKEQRKNVLTIPVTSDGHSHIKLAGKWYDTTNWTASKKDAFSPPKPDILTAVLQALPARSQAALAMLYVVYSIKHPEPLIGDAYSRPTDDTSTNDWLPCIEKHTMPHATKSSSWQTSLWSEIKIFARVFGFTLLTGIGPLLANGALNTYATNKARYHKIRHEIRTCPTAVLNQLLQDKFLNMIPAVHRALQDELAARGTQ